jgi:hypothetical protein
LKYRFLRAAEIELEEAVAYYDEQELGLGDRFLDQVARAIDQIATNPLGWAKIEIDIRRCATGNFPFHIIYKIYSDEFLIIAIMHMRRKPLYWKKRIGIKSAPTDG